MNSLHQAAKSEKAKELTDTVENLRKIVPRKTQRAPELAQEKDSSLWLTVLPLQEKGFNLNKRELPDAIKLRYDWPFDDIPGSDKYILGPDARDKLKNTPGKCFIFRRSPPGRSIRLMRHFAQQIENESFCATF